MPAKLSLTQKLPSDENLTCERNLMYILIDSVCINYRIKSVVEFCDFLWLATSAQRILLCILKDPFYFGLPLVRFFLLPPVKAAFSILSK